MRPPAAKTTAIHGKAATRAAMIVGVLSVVLATAAVSPASPATKKTKTVKCSVRLQALIAQPAPTAANVGTAMCRNGLGGGMQRDSSTVTPSSAIAGAFDGRFKMFFNRGAISGTFRIGYATTPGPANAIASIKYSGTLKVTKGTAAYKRVRGTGTVTGSSSDAVRTSLNYTLKLKNLKTLRTGGGEFEQFCEANPGAC